MGASPIEMCGALSRVKKTIHFPHSFCFEFFSPYSFLLFLGCSSFLSSLEVLIMEEDSSGPCLFLESRAETLGFFTIYAEAFRPKYKTIRNLLSLLAEAVARPPLLHEYRLTPFSIGAAISNGVTEKEAVAFFASNCYGMTRDDGRETALFDQLKNFLHACISRYDLARVVIEGEKTVLVSKNETILRFLVEDRVILALLESPEIHHSIFSWDGEDRSFPYVIGKSRAVSKVLCERCVALGYPLWQQYDFDSDRLLRTTNVSLHPQTRPRSYQVEAVEAATKEGVLNSGCLLLPCGAGKTLVGIMLLCKVKKPTLIVCAGSVSVDQWKNQILEYAVLDSPCESPIQQRKVLRRGADRIACLTGKQKDEISDETDIVLTTYSMLVSAFKLENRREGPRDNVNTYAGRKRKANPKEKLFIPYGLVILDEVHVIPADAFRESLSFIDAKSTIGLTATFVREDRKILDLFHLVGPKLYDISMESLVNLGFLARVQCIEVHTPMSKEFGVEYMEQSMRTSSTGRIPILVILAASNPNKMLCVQDLVTRHVAAGAKILVFCDHLLLLEEYGSMLGAPVICGNTQIKDRLMIFSDFQSTSKVNVVCISRVGDVSVNLPSANVVIQVSSHGGSRRQEAQRLGRILRPKEKSSDKHKTQAWFYSIVSTDTLEMHYAAHRTAFLVDQGYCTRIMEFIPKCEENSGLLPASVIKGSVGDIQSIKQEELVNSLLSSRLVARSDSGERFKRYMTIDYRLQLLAKVVSKWEIEYQKYQRGKIISESSSPVRDHDTSAGDVETRVISLDRTLEDIKREYGTEQQAYRIRIPFSLSIIEVKFLPNGTYFVVAFFADVYNAAGSLRRYLDQKCCCSCSPCSNGFITFLNGNQFQKNPNTKLGAQRLLLDHLSNIRPTRGLTKLLKLSRASVAPDESLYKCDDFMIDNTGTSGGAASFNESTVYVSKEIFCISSIKDLLKMTQVNWDAERTQDIFGSLSDADWELFPAPSGDLELPEAAEQKQNPTDEASVSALKVGEIITFNDYDYLKEDLAFDAMPLKKLYRLHFVPVIDQLHKSRVQAKAHNLSGVFEHKGGLESGAGDVVGLLRHMSAFFKTSKLDSPSPFTLLQHNFKKEKENIDKLFSMRLIEDHHPSRRVRMTAEKEKDSYGATLAGDSFLVSVQLSNMRSQNLISLRIIQEKLLTTRSLSRQLCPTLVTFLLEQLLEECKGGNDSERLSLVIGIVGILVARRGNVLDVLRFLRCLQFLGTRTLKDCRPLVVPFAETIISDLHLALDSIDPLDSLLGCVQEKHCPIIIDVDKKDGVINGMAVSPNGFLVALLLGSFLVLVDRVTGELLRKVELSDDCRPSWLLSFGSPSTIVLTTNNGTRHFLFNEELQRVRVKETPTPFIPAEWSDDENEMTGLHCPFLPSGSRAALYLFQKGNGLKTEYSSTILLSRLTVGVIISSSYEGQVIQIQTTSGETLCAAIRNKVLFLSGYGHTCCAPVSSSLWVQMTIQWSNGCWSLFQNGERSSLHGMNQAPPLGVVIKSTLLFEGEGRIAAISLWSTSDAQEEKVAYEGLGSWLKNLGTERSETLPLKKCYIWDCETPAPVRPKEYPKIMMPFDEVLCRSVLLSKYSLYLLPTDQRGRSGAALVEVHRPTNTIMRLFQCSSASMTKVYALRQDEGEMLVCEPRFLAFSSVKLHSRKPLFDDLVSETQFPPERNSVEQVIQQLSLHIYINASEMKYADSCSFFPSDLDFFLTQLNEVTNSSNTQYVRALLCLTSAYFEAVSMGRLPAPSNQHNVEHTLEQILRLFPKHSGIQTLCMQVVSVAQHSLYSMEKKCAIFFNAPRDNNWDMFFSMFTEVPLASIVQFAVQRGFFDQLETLVIALFCEFDNRSVPSRLPQWMTLFIHILIHVLLANNNKNVLEKMMGDLVHFVEQRIVSWETASFSCHSPGQAVIVAGVAPFFMAVSRSCSDIIGPELEKLILAITFDSTTVHQLRPVPTSPLKQDVWCFTADFSYAETVFIQKDMQSPGLTVLSQGKWKMESETVPLGDTPITVKGDILVLTGHGNNVVTTTANYSLDVDGSWLLVLLQCFEDLMISLARKMWISVPSVEDFKIPVAFRHGLTTTCLNGHGINIVNRDPISTYSQDILGGDGKGLELTESVCHSMRGSILPSMKPAIQSLLAILIHCGATEHEAEKELRLNWFSGNWGINFQGPQRGPILLRLRKLAEWVVSNIHFDRSLSTCLSRSLSRVSQTVSSFRTTSVHYSVMKDLLDSVRATLSRIDGTEMLETLLVQQTQRALSFCRGADVLRQLVRGPLKDKLVVRYSLELLLDYRGSCKDLHVVENVFGAGLDLESRVRESFHCLLREVSATLLDDLPTAPVSTTALVEHPISEGVSLLSLLALYAYPWQEEDYQLMVTLNSFSEGSNAPVWMLLCLRKLMAIPFSPQEEAKHELTMSTPTRQCDKTPNDNPMDHINECLAAVDFGTIGMRITNSFSVSIPFVSVTSSINGASFVRKSAESRLLLRADEAWPTCMELGSPSVYYFEVQLQSQVLDKLFWGLTSGTASYEEASSNFVFAVTSDGKPFPSTSNERDCIPFEIGDIFGCGLDVAHHKVFYTRNGMFWRFAGVIPEGEKHLFPTIFFGETSGVELKVNFGGDPFQFDHCQMHPSVCCAGGPTWYNIFFAAEAVSHFLTSEVWSLETKEERSDIQLLRKMCCDAVCEHINVVSSSLLGTAMDSKESSEVILKKAVMFRIAESSILLQISTLRRLFTRDTISDPVPDIVSSTVYHAVSLVMTLPLQSTLIATLRLLRDVIGEIGSISDDNLNALVKTLFIHAEKEETDTTTIPFSPSWDTCDAQNVALMTSKFAAMLPKAKVSIILGSVLPNSGVFSFSVSIKKQGTPKGRSLHSGYYIGVAKKEDYPSDPLQSWKSQRPPGVWALHDVSPQLPHATNPSVTPNAFMRAYGSGEVITIFVDRDNGTVCFLREGKLLSQLFVDLPQSVNLVPFVQLYNDDAHACLFPGSMTSPITESRLLSAVSVDALRHMLQVQRFDSIVSKYLCKEMNKKTNPKVTFSVFNGAPDPRKLELLLKDGTKQLVTVQDIEQMRYRYYRNGVVAADYAYNFRIPSKAQVMCHLTVEPHDNIKGISQCIEGLVDSLVRHTKQMRSHALLLTEIQTRQSIIDEEGRLFDILRTSLRLGLYQAIRVLAYDSAPFQSFESDFVFSSALSHPMTQIPAQYLGKLVRLKNSAPALSSFISIADPILPDKGVCNLRCRIRRNDDSFTLGGGYYFGVCTESFSWQCSDFARRDDSRPQVWALHDADSSFWRLKHMNADVSFEENIAFFSGDTVRLAIDRDAGTMDAFRKPYRGDEIYLGRIFDSIPVEPLRAFVCLYNNDASAVLLTSQSDRVPVRVMVPKAHFSTFDYSQNVFCSSCSMNQVEEVQLSEDWYKCNDCVNYALCTDCFYRCIHPHHTFTLMNAKKATAHCISPPWKVAVGMKLFIPPGPAIYLRGNSCTIPDIDLESVAIATGGPDSFACWGLLGTSGRFVVSIDSVNSKPLSSKYPVFVGLTTNEDILTLNTTEFSSYVLHESRTSTEGDVVYVCSDPFLDEKGTRSSASGFSNGATIAFGVDIPKRVVSISKDWVHHRKVKLSTRSKYIKDTHLFCFVIFSTEGQKATIYPEHNRTTGAVVTEVNGNVVTAEIPMFGTRVVARDQCRVPLVPLAQQQSIVEIFNKASSNEAFQLYGYIFEEQIMTQCTITKLLATDAVVEVSRKIRRVPQKQLLVDPYLTTTTVQRNLISSPLALGPSVATGCAIFKIALILSSMCQNSILASLIIQHRQPLIKAIKEFASANCSSSPELNMLESIRELIQLPFLWAKCEAGERLHQLVRPYNDSVEKGIACNACVAIATSREHNVYRVTRVRERHCILEPLDGGNQLEVKQELCIEVKQSCGKPWCLDPRGLPSSKREYTLRRAMKNGYKVVSIDGAWRGEIISRSTSFLFDLDLRKENSFESEASVHFTYEVKKFLVYYEYHRYSRVIRLILLNEEHYSFWKSLREKTWRDIVESIESHKLRSDSVYIIKGLMNDSGMQFSGAYRFSDGAHGTLFARLLSRIPLQRERSQDIAVLPECEKDEKKLFTEESGKLANLSNAVVLLSRHLYLLLCYRTAEDFQFFAEEIGLFHRHPASIKLVGKIPVDHVRSLIQRASQIITNPYTYPKDGARLAEFIVVSFLLPSIKIVSPPCFVWDSLHAVVFASHKCGSQLRPRLTQLLSLFLSRFQGLQLPHNYYSLLSPLVSYANHEIYISDNGMDSSQHRDVSGIVEVLLDSPVRMDVALLDSIPVKTLRCLLDIRASIENGTALPQAVERVVDGNTREAKIKCLFGEVDGNFLKVGKVVGEDAVPRKKVYFEVVLTKDEIGTYAIGWGTEQHRRASDTHVGTDPYSIAFLGSTITISGNQQNYDIMASTAFGVKHGTIIGCLLDLSSATVAWSRNGVVGRYICLPTNHLSRDPIFAFVSMNGGSGLSVLLNSNDFFYAPPGYSDICGVPCNAPMSNYNSSLRSTLPVQPTQFYVQLSTYLSRVHLSRVSYEYPIPQQEAFPLLVNIPEDEIKRYGDVIRTIEEAAAEASRFLDLDSKQVTGKISSAYLFFKPMLREFQRLKLIDLSPLTETSTPKDIVVRVEGDKEDAINSLDLLSRTTLFQCYKQLHNISEDHWTMTPLFRVRLFLSSSGHFPIDMGGPYRQTWSIIGQELMRDPDTAGPHFNGVPRSLFRFCNNSKRISLVPDETLDSPALLSVYSFFGRLMGYAARARLSMDIELSPFVWKYLVDDRLCIDDYYKYVDSVVRFSMEDNDFFSNGMAEELIPGLSEKLSVLTYEGLSSTSILTQQRRIAQECLVHSMDLQLTAIREGLRKVLSRRVLRCLFWKDLEELVCGMANPSVKEMKKFFKSNLSSTREAFFWEIVENMTAEQKASLLCFASGQRRLPLVRIISLVENSESEEHLPRAQSCSSLITVPQYRTLTTFQEKLLLALQHQNEMELLIFIIIIITINIIYMTVICDTLFYFQNSFCFRHSSLDFHSLKFPNEIARNTIVEKLKCRLNMERLPFMTVASKANNWVEVLSCYKRMIDATKNIYSPTPAELIHGIKKMTTSWGVSLFYYTLAKRSFPVDSSVAAAALHQYRYCGNYTGMKRVFEEDVEADSKLGARSSILLASYTGMWEKAFQLYLTHPQLSSQPAIRRSLIKALCLHHKWEISLQLLGAGKSLEADPSLVRPVVKALSIQERHRDAIKLVAASLAAGHRLEAELFSAVVVSLRSTGQWLQALQTAERLRLLSSEKPVNSFQFTLYNSIVDCLYQSDIYHSHSVESVARDMIERLQPKNTKFEHSPSVRHFRLASYQDVLQQYYGLLQCLTSMYSKFIRIPVFRKGLHSIVEEIFKKHSIGIVLDTNFLMQCVSKNLPLEHFLPSMVKHNADIKEWSSVTVIVPFTTVQEIHHLIWDPHSRIRHAVKVLLWSRVTSMLQRPGVYALSFVSEYPCSSLSIVSKMAYNKSYTSSLTDVSTNPDCRILNVCLQLQHLIRGKEIEKLQGVSPPDGILLFAFLKYHVRLYNNSVKGPATQKLILCTLDKSLIISVLLASLDSPPVHHDLFVSVHQLFLACATMTTQLINMTRTYCLYFLFSLSIYRSTSEMSEQSAPKMDNRAHDEDNAAKKPMMNDVDPKRNIVDNCEKTYVYVPWRIGLMLFTTTVCQNLAYTMPMVIGWYYWPKEEYDKYSSAVNHMPIYLGPLFGLIIDMVRVFRERYRPCMLVALLGLSILGFVTYFDKAIYEDHKFGPGITVGLLMNIFAMFMYIPLTGCVIWHGNSAIETPRETATRIGGLMAQTMVWRTSGTVFVDLITFYAPKFTSRIQSLVVGPLALVLIAQLFFLMKRSYFVDRREASLLKSTPVMLYKTAVKANLNPSSDDNHHSITAFMFTVCFSFIYFLLPNGFSGNAASWTSNLMPSPSWSTNLSQTVWVLSAVGQLFGAILYAVWMQIEYTLEKKNGRSFRTTPLFLAFSGCLAYVIGHCFILIGNFGEQPEDYNNKVFLLFYYFLTGICTRFAFMPTMSLCAMHAPRYLETAAFELWSISTSGGAAISALVTNDLMTSLGSTTYPSINKLWKTILMCMFFRMLPMIIAIALPQHRENNENKDIQEHISVDEEQQESEEEQEQRSSPFYTEE
eukprot:gene2014-1205_t